MTPLLAYEQVRLFPKKSIVTSRSECVTNVKLGNRSFRIPVTPANMRCTINENLAFILSESDHFYVMHRFGDTRAFLDRANKENWKTISISIGVKEDDYKLIEDVVRNKWRIDYVTIDVAHGHSIAVEKMLEFLRKSCQSVFRIAGNICTFEAAADLHRWGAQAIKVGIAQGAACTTYGKTGFGLPMFSCVLDICKYYDTELNEYLSKWADLPIIADGGIRTNGDIAKALVAGASMVMIGSMFAALSDSPAEVVNFEGVPVQKIYYGSASFDNTKSIHHVEGTTVRLPYDKRMYGNKLVEIKEDLQSAISYAGGVTLGAFNHVKWGYTY